MNEPSVPHVPPIWTADLEGIGGHIGPEPEDFRVDEVPLYAASGEGEHLYVRIEKRGLTTRDAIRRLAEAASVPHSEIGSAGMKDKHAVTTQWLSLPARRARPREEWSLPEGLAVLEVTRHGNKLRTGHLAGNHFRIRITEVSAGEGALPRAQQVLDALGIRGLPNYFGPQRFGHGGANVERGLRWLRAMAGGERGPRLQHFEQKLLSSSIQSEVFNRYLTLRVEAGLARPLTGEVVRLEGTGSTFVVEDPEAELPRWSARDIHPTGVMIGPKAKPARAQALALEEEAAAATGLGGAERAALSRSADGTRRDLMVWPKEVTVVEADPGSLTVGFYLPSGSYATQVVRELTRGPFLSTSGSRETGEA